MSKIRISGDTSGYIDLEIPAIAGTNTVNLDKIVEHDGNGNVGIGTNTPVSYGSQTSLTVQGTAVGRLDLHGASGAGGGNIFGSSTAFEIQANSGIPLQLSSASGQNLTLRTGTDTHLTILASGHVGLGTTTPLARLHLHPDANSSNSAFKMSRTASYDQTWTQNISHEDTARYGTFYLSGSLSTGGIALQPAGIEGIRILANGRVGFGENNPQNFFQIGSTGSFPITMNANYPDIYFNGYYNGGNRSATTGQSGRLSFNGSNGSLTYYNSNSSVTAGTTYALQETFKVNAGGSVDLPLQPSANAYVNSGDAGSYNYAGGANSVIIGSGVRTNVGNCYNNTNGRFTCPTAGRYFVSFSANFYNNGIGSWWRPLIQKNGSTWTQHYENAGGTWMQLSASSIVDCAAGDYLNIYNQTASGSGGGMDTGAYSNINFHKLT